MLSIVVLVAGLWLIVSMLVVGCCVAAAQGDGLAWTRGLAAPRGADDAPARDEGYELLGPARQAS